MNKILNVLIIISIFFIFSCVTAHDLAVSRVALYDKLLGPLITDTKDEVLFYLGAPDSSQKLGTQEIWIYHHTFGVEETSTSTINFNRGFFNNIISESNSASHEIYDKITLYFNSSGRMTNYETFVQR